MKDGHWEKSHVRDELQSWEYGWESLWVKRFWGTRLENSLTQVFKLLDKVLF